ncbi:MAG: SRPBCC domain-containing protein [Candidatus Hermodarchaeota archaeon]
MGLSPREDIAPVIRLRVLINKELDEVWQRFLDPLTMIQWLGDEISADIRSGGHITFLGHSAPTTSEMGNRWEIKELTKRKGILFGWNILGSDSLFVLRFRGINGGTYLELKHGAIPESAVAFHLPEHWIVLLANFKSVMELGYAALRFDYSEYRPLRITRYDPKEVRLSVHIKAPRSLPFDWWTNPEKLRHFIRAEQPIVDRQYAGIYTWWAEGQGPVVFTKMEHDQEIEFTWVYGDELETKVNVRFDDIDGETLVTLHHFGFKQPEGVVGYDIGWVALLAELKLLCELGSSGIERLGIWEEAV